MVKLRTSEFPEGKPRSGWVRTYIDAPHRVDDLVEFSYSLHEDQAAKDSRIDPFYYGSHKAMIRPLEIPHHRIKRTVDGKYIHVSKAEIAPEDMADFQESNPAFYQWETKTPLLWTAPQGSLPPEMFPTYWGDPEPLDPQWPRESFVLDEAEEIVKLLARHDEGLETRKTSGDHIGTTVDLQVGASADDASEFTTVMLLTGPGLGPSDADDEYIGLRFQSVTVANAATVDVCTSDQLFHTAQLDEPLHDMDFEAADDPGEFTTTTSNMSDRTLTGSPVLWDNTTLGAPGTFTSPSLVTPMQIIFNRAGWGTGQSVVMVIVQPTTSALRDYGIRAYDGDTDEAAKLHLEIAADGITEGEIMAATSPHYDLGAFGPATMVPY